MLFFISLIIAGIAIIIGWEESGVSIFPTFIIFMAVCCLIGRWRFNRRFHKTLEAEFEKAEEGDLPDENNNSFEWLGEKKQIRKAQERLIMGPVLVLLSIIALIVEIVA